MIASVYVISNGQALKLGRARNAMQRLTFLQVASPVPLRLVHEYATEDAADVEHTVHGLLSAQRQTGEWFSVSEEEAISAIRAAAEIVAHRKANPPIGRQPSTNRRRTDAQREAERTYDAKRSSPVAVRFSDAHLGMIDAQRGGQTRAAWLKAAALAALGVNDPECDRPLRRW